MTKTRILTGVKPTGTPHLGNYFGALEPAIRRAKEYPESFLFIANYHALNQITDSIELERLTLTITASWLACGLDIDHTYLYAQSDIPEVFELETILNSFTPKGWMNKAHAYKAAVEKNSAESKATDEGVSMGLFSYPVLMAADILIMQADIVPVGKDQIQHVEIARDIAQRINSHYDSQILTLPDYLIEDQIGTVIGIDKRKMSKSYNNIIPLFATLEQRQNSINKIITDSALPDESKEVEGTPLLDLYKLVSTPEETKEFQSALEQGQLGWGDGKKQLAQKLDGAFADKTAEFNRLMANPDGLKQILVDGAKKVRPIARQNLDKIRQSIGII